MGKILVTGGMGYIGSHTVSDLIDKGYETIILDNLKNSDTSVLEGIENTTGVRPLFYEVDIRDYAKMKVVFEENVISGVIHFAASKYVDESVEIPLYYMDNNVGGMINLLKLVKEYKVKNFVFSSSCSVYGDIDELPVSEATPLKPSASPYALTKVMGEQMLENMKTEFEANFMSLRYFNPVGAHEKGFLGESPKVVPLNLLPRITGTALGKYDVLKVFGNDLDTRDGSCIRDYIHVVDIAEAHTMALKKMEQMNSFHHHHIVNLGSGNGVTVLELIDAFKKYTGQELKVELCDPRPGDVVAVYADNSYAKELLGWIPRMNIENMMTTSWEWDKKNYRKDRI